MFQFTHPGRGATKLGKLRLYGRCGFNSRTPGGVRRHRIHNVNYLGSGFNSRTPGGVRLDISWASLPVSRFNSRTPGGVRHQGTYYRPFVVSFNSRTPGGVRRLDITERLITRHVSIHAPREGCDSQDTPKTSRTNNTFQFTHPGRGATYLRGRHHCPHRFQFTHPGRGATGEIVFSPFRMPVSIHAPREGCDIFRISSFLLKSSFNSRTPGGVRQYQTASEP